MRAFIILSTVLALSVPSAAEELERCTEAEDLVKAITTISGFDAEMTTPLALTLQLRATQDGEPVSGQTFFYRDGAERIDLPLTADGLMQNTDKMAGKNKAAELCRTRIDGGPLQDDSISMSAQMSFNFAPGGSTYALATLEEGAKEGRDQLKALAPAAVRLFVPKLTHIVISATGEDAPLPVVTFLKDGAPHAMPELAVSAPGRTMIALSDLKKQKIDALEISGAPYLLQASMKPDTQ